MTPPPDSSTWETLSLYLTMAAAWIVGEGGRAVLAGAAGGLLRWLMSESRRISQGVVSVAAGGLMAHCATPLMLALLEKWFGDLSGDVERTAAFSTGIVGMSLAKLLIAYFEAHSTRIGKKSDG